MKYIGLSGGIGSGKTSVAKIFANCNMPVYYADSRAKELMMESAEIKTGVTKLLGEEAYFNGYLNRSFIAQKIFQNATLRNKINAIVHPEVRKDFDLWASKQTADFVIQENALMFTSDSYKQYDKTIYVSCPADIRIKRVMQRDNATEEQVTARMKFQANDSEASQKANYIIVNDNSTLVIPQVLQIVKNIQTENYG